MIAGLLSQMRVRIAELDEWCECDRAGELRRWADELQAATTWIPVAAALPDEGRRCWVWIEDAYGTGRKLLATRQVAVNGATWWHDIRGEGLSRWRVVRWQYEVVPADPCREES